METMAVGSAIFSIVGFVLSLVFVFAFVNPFLRARGYALWFNSNRIYCLSDYKFYY